MPRMSDAEWARMTGQTKKKAKPKAKAKPRPKAKPKKKTGVRGAYATLKGRGKALDAKIRKAGG